LVGLVSTLRKQGLDAELVAQVVTQLRLRHRARAKFGDFANQMLFTEAGLEQASRLAVAAHHANRFKSAGISSVADLGCGIGADSLAFASMGLDVVAVERDPETAALAAYNLAAFENAKVEIADAETYQAQTQALWFDPARRNLETKSESRQMLSPADFSPNLDHVFEMARTKPTGVKLGPAFPHELIPADCEAQWVSHEGDLVELTLWFNGLGKVGRSALMLGDSSHSMHAANVELAEVGELGQYLYEPDPSLIRSGLMGNLANSLGLVTISSGIAYLSGGLVSSPWLKTYEVIEVLPLDEKRLASWCRENDIGVVEIKKRGVDITPEALRPKLKLKGAGAVTMVLTKVGDARKALICKPIR
jgi:SAM-dependent methyltransferase